MTYYKVIVAFYILLRLILDSHALRLDLGNRLLTYGRDELLLL